MTTENVVNQYGAWTCVCGNEAETNGFFAYTEGREVEPTPEDWTTGLYFCAACLRLIDGQTGDVKGQAETVTTLDDIVLTADQ